MIGGVFAAEDKVVTVDESGFMILWRLAANELVSLKDFGSMRVRVTAISTCPHAGWLVAIGLQNGGIYLVDLRSKYYFNISITVNSGHCVWNLKQFQTCYFFAFLKLVCHLLLSFNTHFHIL